MHAPAVAGQHDMLARRRWNRACSGASMRLRPRAVALRAGQEIRICTLGKTCQRQGSKQASHPSQGGCCPSRACTHTQPPAHAGGACPHDPRPRCFPPLQLLKFAQDLGLSELSVQGCGCLGE